MAQAEHLLLDPCASPRAGQALCADHTVTAASVGAPPLQLFVSHELDAVEAEWRCFEQHADCTVFQSFDWLATWQQHIGRRSGTVPAIVVGRDRAGETLFILPLATQRIGPLTWLTFLGRDLGDYNAPLLATEFRQRVGRGFQELWREVCARLQGSAQHRFDLTMLDKMPERVGHQRNPMLELDVELNPSGAYLTGLSGTWDEFYTAKRSSSSRKRDRTKGRRLAEMGEVRTVTASTPDEAARTLTRLMEQKKRAFGRMGIADMFERPGYRDFFLALAIDPRARDLVHISRLEVGPTWAATNFGLVFRGGYSHVLTSYDDGPVSRFGPGSAHLQHLLRHALENGCTYFDFTIGDEPYKRDWSDTELRLYDHVRGATWRGRMLASAIINARHLKRAVKQSKYWPAALRLRAQLGAFTARPSKQRPAPTANEHE